MCLRETQTKRRWKYDRELVFEQNVKERDWTCEREQTSDTNVRLLLGVCVAVKITD